MKQTFIVFTFSLFSQLLFSQASKTSVAVMPFGYSALEYRNRASHIQEMVVEMLGKKSNILAIDRSKDTFLLKELDNQIREQSMGSNKLVKQGKVLGAQNMIVGAVSNATVEELRTTSKNLLTGQPQTLVNYKATVSFSLQLMDVETGKIISQKSFNNQKDNPDFLGLVNSGMGTTKETALSNAMESTRKSIYTWINECYPPDIKILKIENRDKKGFPQTILVTGIDASLAKGAKLILNEIEMLDAGDGKKLRRSKKIAELKISEKQDEITVCKVTDGEKNIEGKMNNGAKLEILIK